MAWISINSAIRAGSLVRYDDIGVWLNAASSNALSMTSTHCPGHYTGYNTATHSHSGTNSVYSGNGNATGNESVRFSGFSKCGGEFILYKRGK